MSELANTSWFFHITEPALVAQMVERKTLNLVVVGSIPTEGVPFLLLPKSPTYQKEFPDRELNPGLTGESRVS